VKEYDYSFIVGDLVTYSNPKFYMAEDALPPFGVVFLVEGHFAKVFWSDGVIYLESMVDLRLVKD
tara:strand:- start:23401 stop:23595 length:195 start_codon:yes stop_codon:yes gene_type:complete